MSEPTDQKWGNFTKVETFTFSVKVTSTKTS
jgi:hypothetical protein